MLVEDKVLSLVIQLWNIIKKLLQQLRKEVKRVNITITMAQVIKQEEALVVMKCEVTVTVISTNNNKITF